MVCLNPISAYKTGEKTKNGKDVLSFDRKKYAMIPPNSIVATNEVQFACGQCIGCRLKRSRDWAVRCIHESKFHEHNSFITLTYAPEYLKSDSLIKEDFQKFMKRFRKKIGCKIRYLMCGEYGEKLSRPHFHALIFGYDFPDKKLLFKKSNYSVYTSEELSLLWPYGISSIGELNFETAQYVAGYILKKRNGKTAEEYYQGKNPEYITMSRRPGLGYEYYQKYFDDLYPSKYCIIKNGVKVGVPRYYNNCLEKDYPEMYKDLQLDYTDTYKLMEDTVTKLYKGDLQRIEDYLYTIDTSKKRNFEI